MDLKKNKKIFFDFRNENFFARVSGKMGKKIFFFEKFIFPKVSFFPNLKSELGHEGMNETYIYVEFNSLSNETLLGPNGYKIALKLQKICKNPDYP